MASPDDNHAIHRVAVQRTRQACGPCRRKKARCPGERPTCSLCRRLGQRCTYTQRAVAASESRSRISQTPEPRRDGSPQSIHREPIAHAQQFNRIEERLDELTRLIRQTPLRNALPAETPPKDDQRTDPTSQDHIDGGLLVGSDQSESEENLSRISLSSDFVAAHVDLYLNHFHEQPYSVFSKGWLSKNADSLGRELIFPLIALTSRLLSKSETPGAKNAAVIGWDILSSQYQSGKLGLSFLQGTFLMAQADLAAGRSDRACTSIALGLRILQSAGLHRKDAYLSSTNSDEIETQKRIVWSFFMLDRHYSASRTYSLALADKHFTLPFPSSTETGPEGFLNANTLPYRPGRAGSSVDHGILSCLIRLSSIWGKATEYIFEPLDATAQPPWQSGSALAVLESDWLQFQTHFADAHRYMNVDFRRRAREEPSSRAYLSTWLCVQFLFHSLQGFLHHPFVVSSKLRAVEGNIPSTFLQKCYESSLIHSRWIARFVREMTEVDMRLYDPFIGYLCAIAATIQLEHTVGNNQQVARLAKKDYRILVDYVIQMSEQWENMRVLATRLNELAFRRRKYGSLYENQEQFSGILPRMPTSIELPRMSAEDEALMWDILDFNSSCNFAQAFDLGGLTSLNEHILGSQNLARDELAPPVQGQTTADQQAPFVQQLPMQGMSPFFATTMDPGSDVLLPESDDPGLSLPDPTDWLLFGGYLGEQL